MKGRRPRESRGRPFYAARNGAVYHLLSRLRCDERGDNIIKRIIPSVTLTGASQATRTTLPSVTTNAFHFAFAHLATPNSGCPLFGKPVARPQMFRHAALRQLNMTLLCGVPPRNGRCENEGIPTSPYGSCDLALRGRATRCFATARNDTGWNCRIVWIATSCVALLAMTPTAIGAMAAARSAAGYPIVG